MTDAAGQNETVRLSLVCHSPPAGLHNGSDTEFGLQDRQQHLMPGERQADGSLQYRAIVQVRGGDADAAPRLSGPYVHGTAAAPFLYLSWREVGAERSSWIKRLKIPLRSLSREQLRAARDASESRLETTVDGRGSGTVPLIGEGWVLRSTQDA